VGKNHPAVGIGCTREQNIIFVFRGDRVFTNDDVGMGVSILVDESSLFFAVLKKRI